MFVNPNSHQNMIASTTAPTNTVQWVITLDNMDMSKSIKRALLSMKGVVSVKDAAPRTRRTMAELDARIKRAEEDCREGRVYRQMDGESTDAFIDRMLCIK